MKPSSIIYVWKEKGPEKPVAKIFESTNVSCHHRNFKRFRLEICEKFYFEIWANFDH
jgi:hypothetical protein